ncbi:tetratricopeptide repeat protein [Bacteroidota bacterium]
MRSLAILIILIIPFVLHAEDARDYIRKGNEQYKKEKFNEAEINYRKSLEQDNKSHKAVFNLGDALYKQEQYDKAAQEFVSIANQKIDDETTAMAYHNLGNSLLKSKKLHESVDAYKNSLRLNPKDMDTKYNLEYVRRLMQQQQQKQDQNKDQNKQDKKDQQNQDKKDQQNQDKKDQQQQNQEKQNQKKNQKQQGSKEQKISKKDAERILQALMQEEKKLQKKLKKKVKGVRGKVEKEW